MAGMLFGVGIAVGATLLGLLWLTLASPSFRIWPTPGNGSWQGYVFWPLFRSLNVLCFAVALVDRKGFLGLPDWIRAFALGMLLASIAAFLYLITPVSPPFRHKPQLLSVEGRIREADDGTQRGAIPARAECRGVQ